MKPNKAYSTVKNQLQGGIDDTFGEALQELSEAPGLIEGLISSSLPQADPVAAGQAASVLDGYRLRNVIDDVSRGLKQSEQKQFLSTLIDTCDRLENISSRALRAIFDELLNNAFLDPARKFADKLGRVPPDILDKYRLYDDDRDAIFDKLIEDAGPYRSMNKSLENALKKSIQHQKPGQFEKLLDRIDGEALQSVRGSIYFALFQNNAGGCVKPFREHFDLETVLAEFLNKDLKMIGALGQIGKSNRLLRQQDLVEEVEDLILEHTDKARTPALRADFRCFDAIGPQYEFDGQSEDETLNDELRAAVENENIEAIHELAEHTSIWGDDFRQACKQNSLEVLQALREHYTPSQKIKDWALKDALTHPVQYGNGHEHDPAVIFELGEMGAEFRGEAGSAIAALIERIGIDNNEWEQFIAAFQTLTAIGFEPTRDEADVIFETVLSDGFDQIRKGFDQVNLAEEIPAIGKKLLEKAIRRQRFRPEQNLIDEAPEDLRQMALELMPGRATNSVEQTTRTDS